MPLFSSGEAPAGAIGTEGPVGQQGAQGTQGPQGRIGSKGPVGVMGTQGPDGPQGPQGSQGPMGTQGPIGFQGPQGIQGIQGPDGTQGPTGFQGPTGNQGPIGAQGSVGTTGLKGPTGPFNSLLYPNGQSLAIAFTNNNCYLNNASALTGGTFPLTDTSSSYYTQCAQLASNSGSSIFGLTTDSTGAKINCVWGDPNISTIYTMNNAMQNGPAYPNATQITQGKTSACTKACGDNTNNMCGNTGSYNLFQVIQKSPMSYMPLSSAYVYPYPSTNLG
jgi:hypothetical protein